MGVYPHPWSFINLISLGSLHTVMIYSKEALQGILSEANASGLEEYPRYNQRLRVKFRCECGKETSKRFEMLALYRLPYCEGCSLKIKEKRKQTSNLEKYGCINTGSVQDIKDKIQRSNKDKFGCHPKQTKVVQDKWKATCLKKYGGHPNQNKEVQAKSEANSYHYKDYMMPTGNIVKYQGYENLALDELVQLYEEHDLCIGRTNIPTIDYYIGDVKHVYFPDFFIRSENKIIEVKSEWTMKIIRANIEEKAQATVKAGFKYEIWIYNNKRVKVEKRVY